METLVLQDEAGEPGEVHPIASGLDHPGVGPQHVHLRELGHIEYVREGDVAERIGMSGEADEIVR